MIFEKFYCVHEEPSLVPLNVVGHAKDWRSKTQWTGEIFKDRPPVIFGFLFHSSGCPSIDFIEQSENSVRINCDNRH